MGSFRCVFCEVAMILRCRAVKKLLSLQPLFDLVVVAQLVELQIVVLAVVGSSPIDHPSLQ